MDTDIGRLRHFVGEATALTDAHGQRDTPAPGLFEAFQALVSHDDWLPDFCTVPHPEFYQQFLLHCDPLERFSIVSFVWGPGQQTPVHDHTVWGCVGMLRGAEMSQRYVQAEDGTYQPDGAAVRLEPGQIEILSPQEGDIHQVWNAYQDRASISVHMYGGNIGAVARSVYESKSGQATRFVSGYSSPVVPNLWDRSAQVRAAR